MVRRHRAGVALALLSLAFSGCGEHRSLVAPLLDSNAAPAAVSVRATRLGPAAATGLVRYRIEWKAPPGAADHFVYTLDPRASSTVDARWTSTRATSFDLAVPSRSTALEYVRAGRATPASTFLIRAVDRGGRISPLGGISIVADNIAPSVQITQPVPTDRARAYLPPTFTVHWAGNDPDGQSTTQPVRYKYTLLTAGTPVSFQTALENPDSVRRYYEPTGYAAWDSVGGDSTSATYTGLLAGQDYMFVVVAQDEQGAYTQVMDLNSNMLNMRIVPEGQGGPLLTLFNSSFFYAYAQGVYSTDPRFQVPVQVAASTPVTMNWTAVIPAASGATLNSFRWALDIADVFDPTPRSDENTDFAHWSTPSLATTSATVGPFGPGETHLLYVEATDSNGLKSLGIVRITSTAPFEPTHDLLIVDDTRLKLDRSSPGATCVTSPAALGPWPTAAECDTFLYARGGFPWRCYPEGTLSPPGLFTGYDFDTLGTLGIPSGTVPLSTLVQYRHVIWLTDQFGALNTGAATNYPSAITALRSMSGPGAQNVLAEYVRSGGNLWLAGGGIAMAAMMPWNSLANDSPVYGPAFSSLPTSPTQPIELAPSRFPYEILGWRSEIRSTFSIATISRSPGRFSSGGAVYDGLPSAMRLRTLASDPVPPLRSSQTFYPTSAEIEYLDLANPIPGPGGTSDLDSLYSATGPALVPPSVNPSNVCMTVYHPMGRNPVIFTGFSLWGFQRADSKALVDFVLGRMWATDETPYSPPIRENDPQPIARRAH